MDSKAKKYKRVLEGIVVSDKMDKTIVVKVESKQKHCKSRKQAETPTLW